MGLKSLKWPRSLDIHRETARYWFRQLLKRGFRVQASRNHEKLGMKRVVMVVELGDLFESYADALMYAMGELCYVVSFAKTLPDGFYVVNASVPLECLDSWSGFIRSLKEMGVFKSITSIPRLGPQPSDEGDLYDFQEGRWDFDWNKRVSRPNASYVPSRGRGLTSSTWG